MPDTDDEAVIGQVLAGDREAYRTLVERYGRAVYRLALRITGNSHDAEDVVQEAFLRAFRQLHRFESRSSFRTWISRIASNYALDLARARSRFEDRSGNAGNERRDWAEAASAESLPADRAVYGGEVRRGIEAAMKDLSPRERYAFELRHHEGMSIEEISGVLGISASAAKHSIFRAVQKLRRALEPLMSTVP